MKIKGRIRAGIVSLLFGFSILAGCGQNKMEEYRQIQVHKVEGTAKVERQGSNMEAYNNMQLQSGDLAETITESYVQLRLDEDKYILMEPDTKISLVATGNEVDSKTSIYLEKGAIINQLDNPLSEGSSYEVITPNSTMAVRGTTFRVELTVDETGITHTAVGVYGGKVESRLIFPDGTIGEPVMVEKGTQVLIKGDEIETEYVNTENVDYDNLEEKVFDFLDETIDRGKELSITKEELKALKEKAVLKKKSNEKEKTEDVKPNEKLKEDEKIEEQTEIKEMKPLFENLDNTETIVSDEILELPTLKEDDDLEEDRFDDFYYPEDSDGDTSGDSGNDSTGSGNSGSGSGGTGSGNSGSGSDGTGSGSGGSGSEDSEDDDGTEEGGTEGDGTEGGGTGEDGTEGDGTEGGGTGEDGTEGDGTEGDGTEGGGIEGDGTEGDGTGEDTGVTESRTIVISFYCDGQLFAAKEQNIDNTATSITITQPVLQPFESSEGAKGWQIEENTEFWIEGFDSKNANYPYVFLEGNSETICFNAGAENLNISFRYITAE